MGKSLTARYHPGAWLRVHHSEGDEDRELPTRRGVRREGLRVSVTSLSSIGESLSHRAGEVWGLITTGLYLINDQQMLGIVLRDMQRRQALNGLKICMFGLFLKHWMHKKLSLAPGL